MIVELGRGSWSSTEYKHLSEYNDKEYRKQIQNMTIIGQSDAHRGGQSKIGHVPHTEKINDTFKSKESKTSRERPLMLHNNCPK